MMYIKDVWRTQKRHDAEKPKPKKFWWMLKLLIRVLVVAYKVLRFLTDDSDNS